MWIYLSNAWGKSGAGLISAENHPVATSLPIPSSLPASALVGLNFYRATWLGLLTRSSLPADLRLHSQSLQTFGQTLKHYLFVSHKRIWGLFKCAIQMYALLSLVKLCKMCLLNTKHRCKKTFLRFYSRNVFMAALRSRCGRYIFAVVSSFFLLFLLA